MAVFDKNIGYTLSNVTNGISSLEAKIFPNTKHLLWATWLRPIREKRPSGSGVVSLPSKVQPALTGLGVHQRGRESGLDDLEAE